MSVSTMPRFDRARCAAEFRRVVNGDDRWDRKSQTGSTYIAIGSKNGKVTVAAVERDWVPAEVPEEADGAGECRWQVLHYVEGQLMTDTYPSAEDAVRAAVELADPAVTS